MIKKLKILFTIHHGRVHSGSGIQMGMLMEELLRRGHAVHGLFKGWRGKPLHPTVQKLADLGVKCEQVRFTKMKYKHTIPELLFLRKYLSENSFDVVNSFGGTDLGQVVLTGFGLPIPAIISYRGMAMPLDPFNSIKYRMRRVNRIIANSQAVKDIMVETGHVSSGKITVIYGGIDLERFNPKVDGSVIRKEFGLAPETPVVIIIGHLKFDAYHRKGGYYFLKAAELLLQSKPETRFILVGKIDMKAWEEMAGPALKKAAITPGFRSDIPELIAASNVLVNSSLSEGMAGVIREALAMAKPVVATDIDGTPELVRPRETGLLVPPRNPQALADGLKQALENPDQGRVFGLNGRKLVEELNNNSRRVDRYEQIYYEEYEKSPKKQ